MNRGHVASTAAAAALRLRLRSGLGLTDTVCVYDLAEKLGVEIWFLAAPSLEGMSARLPKPVIVLSSLRPPGRIAFTCAHELGHLDFEHELRVDCPMDDEPLFEGDVEEEYVANVFASYLLIPKTALQHAARVREMDLRTITAEDAYDLACYFGVGYTTLLTHMAANLRLLSAADAGKLKRAKLGRIRKNIVGRAVKQNLIVVDSAWTSRPIDLEVGDELYIRADCVIDGTSLISVKPPRSGETLIRAERSGVGQVTASNSWSCRVRVQKKKFVGRATFRHREDVPR